MAMAGGLPSAKTGPIRRRRSGGSELAASPRGGARGDPAMGEGRARSGSGSGPAPSASLPVSCRRHWLRPVEAGPAAVGRTFRGRLRPGLPIGIGREEAARVALEGRPPSGRRVPCAEGRKARPSRPGGPSLDVEDACARGVRPPRPDGAIGAGSAHRRHHRIAVAARRERRASAPPGDRGARPSRPRAEIGGAHPSRAPPIPPHAKLARRPGGRRRRQARTTPPRRATSGCIRTIPLRTVPRPRDVASKLFETVGLW